MFQETVSKISRDFLLSNCPPARPALPVLTASSTRRCALGGLILFIFLITATASAEVGQASYYTIKSCQREGCSGVWTASGERYNEKDFTCALRSHKFGEFYRVTNLENGRSIIVRHNDYGPSKRLSKRIIDLTPAAFQELGGGTKGLIEVQVEKLKCGERVIVE